MSKPIPVPESVAAQFAHLPVEVRSQAEQSFMLLSLSSGYRHENIQAAEAVLAALKNIKQVEIL